MAPPAAMANASCAAVSFLLPFADAKPSRRKPVVVVSISTPPPSRLSKRKNYLRPKLLKTLTKIYPNPLISQESPAEPLVPAESPHEQQPESPSDHFSGDSCPNIAGEDPKESQWSEIPVSEASSCATGLVDGRISDFSTRSVFKIGFYLLGAFVFQTICAVWVLGSADSDGKDGNLDIADKNRVLGFGMNRANKGKSSFVVNGSDTLFGKAGSKHAPIIYMDEFEMEKKIVEIREMAREARERERLESKARGSGFSEDDDVVVKTAIEKEVDRRLVKLRKRLENDNGELLASSINYLNKNVKVDDVVEKDGLGAKEANKTLMFEKKYKFRSPQTQPRNKPKGFQGLESPSVTKTEGSLSVREDQMGGNGSAGYDDGDSLDKQQLNLSNGKSLGNNYIGLDDDSRRKPLKKEPNSSRSARRLGKEKGRTEVEVNGSEKNNGIVQESSLGRLSTDAVELADSWTTSKALNSQLSAKENQNTATISNKGDMLDTFDSLKSGELGKKQPAVQGRNKKSYTKPDLWWLNLPYVLAVLMSRGHDGEGPMGLFTLKLTSRETDEDDEDDSSSSHVVAFEDRGDATNFCYILHSFFDDLGDFSADIVPLVTKELVEDVKSHAMKVVVVKKGQLQLYAGQPLADVETALRSLIK